MKKKVNDSLGKSQDMKTRMKSKDAKIGLLEKESKLVKNKNEQDTGELKDWNTKYSQIERNHKQQSQKIQHLQKELNARNLTIEIWQKKDEVMRKLLLDHEDELTQAQQQSTN